jgi:hypothetical protein
MNPKQQNSHTTPYREVIRALVRALRAVPKEVRRAWRDELLKKHDQEPEECVLFMVLNNLAMGELFAQTIAERRAQQQRPTLVSIPGRTGWVGPETVGENRPRTQRVNLECQGGE